MKQTQLFKALIEEGFSEEAAIACVMAKTIMGSVKLKKAYTMGKKSFTEKVEKKFHAVAWQFSEEVRETALYIVLGCLYDYEIDHAMSELNGTAPRTFTQLLAEVRGDGK